MTRKLTDGEYELACGLCRLRKHFDAAPTACPTCRADVVRLVDGVPAGEDTRRYRYALVRIMAHTGRAGIDGHTRDLALANGLLDSIARIAREALPAASRSPETGDTNGNV